VPGNVREHVAVHGGAIFPDDHFEQARLAAEPIIECAFGAADACHDVVDGQLLISSFEEQLRHELDDLAPPRVGDTPATAGRGGASYPAAGRHTRALFVIFAFKFWHCMLCALAMPPCSLQLRKQRLRSAGHKGRPRRPVNFGRPPR
jgi:hypothetical protein